MDAELRSLEREARLADREARRQLAARRRRAGVTLDELPALERHVRILIARVSGGVRSWKQARRIAEQSIHEPLFAIPRGDFVLLRLGALVVATRASAYGERNTGRAYLAKPRSPRWRWRLVAESQNYEPWLGNVNFSRGAVWRELARFLAATLSYSRSA